VTGRLFAQESGGGLQAVLLLHGFGGTHADWAGLLPALAARARTLAFDLPGHGLSLDFPGAGRRSSPRRRTGEMDARSLARAHLAGHSLGGAVAG